MIGLIVGGTILGTAVFFLGMILMNHSITSLSSHKLKKYIQRSTSNPFFGVMVGILVTALTQSSSGTTVMVVSLVNSRSMNLYQATSIIMGANIGTTFTGQLVAFDFFSLVPKILFFGFLLHSLNISCFSRKVGNLLIGFSCLFIGINIMVYFLDPLKQMMAFKELIISVGDHRLLGILLGAFTTAIIQSSSTGVAIMQGLAHNGLLTITFAMPVMLGLNIGTCVTTLVSSLASDKNGKRAAIIHLLFNFFGAVAFFPFITLFSNFIYTLTPTDYIKQISNAHSLFNIFNTILLFPFIPKLVGLSKKIIR